MQNNNILLFVRSLSLTSLIKALLLSKVHLSTIKHQHSKNLTRWTEATWTKSTWKIKNANCLQEFVHKKRRVFKCPPFAWTHAWRRFLHWSVAVSM